MAMSPLKAASPAVQPGQRIDTTSYELRLTHPLRSRSSSAEGHMFSTDIRVRRSHSTDDGFATNVHDVVYRRPFMVSVTSMKDGTMTTSVPAAEVQSRAVARDAVGTPVPAEQRLRGELKPFAWQKATSHPEPQYTFRASGQEMQYRPGPPQRTSGRSYLGSVAPSRAAQEVGTLPFAVQRTLTGRILTPLSPSQQFSCQYSPPQQTPSGTRLPLLSPSQQSRYRYPAVQATASGTRLAAVPLGRLSSGQTVGYGFWSMPRTPSEMLLRRVSPGRWSTAPGYEPLPLRRAPSATALRSVSPSLQYRGRSMSYQPSSVQRTPSGTTLGRVSPSRQLPGQGYSPFPVRRASSAALLRPVLSNRQYIGVSYQPSLLRRTPSGTLIQPMPQGWQYLDPRYQPSPLRRTASGTSLGPMSPSRQYVAPGYKPLPAQRTSSETMLRQMSQSQYFRPTYGLSPLRQASSGTSIPRLSPRQGFQPLPVRRSPSGTMLGPVSPNRQYFPRNYQPLPISRPPSGTILRPASPSRQYLPDVYQPLLTKRTPSASMIGRMTPGRTTLLAGRPSQYATGAGTSSRPWLSQRSPSWMSLVGTPPKTPLVLHPPAWYMSQPRGGTPVDWMPPKPRFVLPLRSPGIMSPSFQAYMRKYRRHRHALLEWIVVWVFIVTVAVVLLSMLVVYNFQRTRLDENADRRLRMLTKLSMPMAAVNDSIERHIVRWPNDKMIRNYLREVTKYTKAAGETRSPSVAQYLQEVWKNYGMTDTKLARYSVLLPVPDKRQHNRVAVSSSPGTHRWTPLVFHEKGIPGVVTTFTPPFNAYSSSGNITGTVVYCNRCLREDFQRMVSMKLSTWRKICLCRYSAHVSPGTAMTHADDHDVAGVLFFLDPVDVAPHSGKPVFPNSWWMPPSVIRRSNVRSDGDVGDPTTRGYSSRGFVENLYRCPVSELHLPKALSQPISSTSAQTVFKHMQGTPCPAGWEPQLGVPCNLGDKSETKVRMHIFNNLEMVNIENVIGYIQGFVEPDRYVVLGVPIDGWDAGGVYPGTAVAQMLELSRVFGHLVMKKGWKPRRTIVFAGWDGHKFGHLGATEYTEGRRRTVMSRAAIYVNSDMCTSGGEFMMSASPSVMGSFENAGIMVPHFRSENKSFYSVWQSDPSSKKTAEGFPVLPELRSEGSHLPVVQFTGVPSLDVSFGNNHSHGLYYPAMGTGYDTFDLVDKFVDPGFKVQLMCAQLIGVVLRRWADAVILPYDFTRLRRAIKSSFDELQLKHSAIIGQHNIDIGPMKDAVRRIVQNLESLGKYVETFPLMNPIATRELNDRIMYMERIFVQDVVGSPGIVRNVLFGWSTTNKGRMVFFPVLDEMLSNQRPGKGIHIQPILLHISRVTSAIHQAADFIDFARIV